tara:strand:- start:47751 stop:48794 length:1044 start_codon:yes stop_codon:yes gene_type:complete
VKRQGRQAEAFCSQPDASINAALIFGKPGAPVSEFAEQLARSWISASAQPLDLVRVPPEDAKNDPDAVAEGLFSPSLFGGASLIQATISRETEARPFLNLLAELEEMSEPPAGRLLIIAGDLGPRSTLRKTVEGLSKAVSLQLFERTDRDFERWVKDALAKAKLLIEADAESLLIQTLLQDQSLAQAEIEKLSIYADDLGRSVTIEDIRSLIVLEDQSSGFDLIDLALDGQRAPLARLLQDQVHDDSAAIPVLIGLVNNLKRLVKAHELSASGVQGKAIGEKLTPRIYERQWPAFERRLSKWAPDRLFALLNRVEEVDVACRQAGSPQDALVRRLLLDVATAAAASR